MYFGISQESIALLISEVLFKRSSTVHVHEPYCLLLPMKETLGEMFAEIWEVHNSEFSTCMLHYDVTVSTVTVTMRSIRLLTWSII